MPETDKKDLLKKAYTDELTGLYNRRYLKENIRGYIQKLVQRNYPLTLLIIDLDDFKDINDQYGHLAGDKILSSFALILKKICSNLAVPIRYAGDEFIVLIPRHEKDAGKSFGEKVISVLSKGKLRIDENTKVKVSVSAGVASLPKDASSFEELFKCADEALYIAKQNGRQQVQVYPDSGKIVSPEILYSMFPLKEPVGYNNVFKKLRDNIAMGSDSIPVLYSKLGMGKSFILDWVIQLALKENIQLLTTAGVVQQKMQPLSTVLNAVENYRKRNIEEFNKVVMRMPENRQATLLDVLGVEPIGMSWKTSDLRKSLESFFGKLVDNGMAIILVDDIHKADFQSLVFLDRVLDKYVDKQLVSIFTFERNTQNPAAMIEMMKYIPKLHKRVDIIELKGFKREDLFNFISKGLDKNPFDKNQLQIFYENCEGSPLYIQETLKYLFSTSRLKYNNGEWIVDNLNESDFTLSLARISKARIVRLDPQLISVLTRASVIGDCFNTNILAELTGLSEDELFTLLHKGIEAHVIKESDGLFGDYKFVNTIDRNVLSSIIDSEEMQKIHERITEILMLNNKQQERIIGALIYHMNMCGNWSEATSLYHDSDASVGIEDTRRKTKEALLSAELNEDKADKIKNKNRKKVKERTFKDKELKRAVILIRAIKLAIMNLRLYPRTNSNVQKSIDTLYNEITMFLEISEGITINVTNDAIIINGSDMSQNDVGSLPGELFNIFTPLYLKGVQFIRGLTKHELTEFLDLTSQRWDDGIDWEKELAEKKITNIYPDEKVYVAVGEHKLLAERSDKIAIGNEAGLRGTDMNTQQFSAFSSAMAQFHSDSKALIEKLIAGTNADGDVKELINRLKSISENGLISIKNEVKSDTNTGATRTTQFNLQDAPPDFDLEKKANTDVHACLEDLADSSRERRAVAVARLATLKQKLPEVVFNFMTISNPVKQNRTAAYILQKQGESSVTSFLNKINPGLPANKLGAILDVSDIFTDYKLLYDKLGELIPQANPGTLAKIEKILLSAPPKKAENAIATYLDSANFDTRIRLLKTAEILKSTGLCGHLKEWLKPLYLWEKPLDDRLLIEAARAAGNIPDPDEKLAKYLRALAVPPSISPYKKPSNELRVAAVYALTRLNPPWLPKLLEKLVKDKNERVSAQAKNAMSS